MPSGSVLRKYKTNIKILVAGILLAFFVLAGILFQHAGNWLVMQETPEKADAILILMGSTGDRSLQAFDLYEAAYANQLIMVSDNEPAKDLLAERGIFFPNESDKTRQMLMQLGVSDSLIFIIPGNAHSTKEEAMVVRAFIQDNPQIDTLLLVTSASHSRRATLTFRKTLSNLNHPVLIISCPSRYSEFEAKRWWTNRNNAKLVVYEYIKLVYFWVWDRF